MSIRGWLNKWVQSPRGVWSKVAQKKTGNPSRASQVANIRVEPGVAKKRPGTSAIFASDVSVTGMFNWVTPAEENLVLYKGGNGIQRFSLNADDITTLLTSVNGAVQPSFADLDVWTYFAAYDTAGVGTIQAEIYDGVNVDKAFRGPLTLTFGDAYDVGAGYCTAGSHFFGVVYQNRTGYSGKPTTSVDFPITATAKYTATVTSTATVGFTVASVSSNPASPVSVGLPGHTFVDGDIIYGVDALGDTAINGRFIVVNSVAATSVQLTDLSGNTIYPNGVWISGGTMTRPTTPEVLTLSANPFLIGMPVVINGGNEGSIIGNFTIGSSTGASITLLDKGVPVAGDVQYTGGATITSSDILTVPGNYLVTGQQVTISGALGDTAPNGVRIAYVVSGGGGFIGITDINGVPVMRNGTYTGSGVITAPIQLILSSNGRKINVTITLPAQPDGGTDANGSVQATLFLIATPASNPAAWFFIPDFAQTGQIGELPVPLNSAQTYTFVMNVSDEDMLADYDSANPNFLLLSQDSTGAGPFNPSFVSVYGLRMVYGDGTICYVSDLSAPQQIASDLNRVAMPNQRRIAYAFQLPNGTDMYLTGDRWTARVTDNSDSPSTWPEPIKVSSGLGAPFANCVCNQTAGNYSWIVVESGIYLFDGGYAEKPLTYLMSDYWATINWAAAYCIEIHDDAPNMRLYVSVPLGSSTVPNVVIVFDYQDGITFDAVDIGIDSYTAHPTIGSICVVKEPITDKNGVWVGPSGAGNVVHYDDNALNDDGNIPISAFWISGLFLGTSEMTAQMIRVGSADIWVRGEGTLGIVWRGPDNVKQVISQLQTIQGVITDLSPQPGLMYQTNLDFTQIENFTFSVGTNSLDAWWELSGFRVYYKPDYYNR